MSLLDFIYRMRVRSNYDDPEMFIYGQTDADTAVAHYRNLLNLVELFGTLCKSIVRRKIGRNAFEGLAAAAHTA